MSYQPRTGARCGCKRGQSRDNCPACEGTGWMIDFARVRALLLADPYALRVAELEAEGLTTSDAQGVADAEILRRSQ